MGLVLVGCEESQAVTAEFRRLGYEAYSCDLIECSGDHPEYHLKMDVLEALQISEDKRMLPFMIQCPNGIRSFPFN